MNRLIVIAGPTASGKTALAIDLAKELNAEIFNADSRQFYTGMDIGTAKPTLEERSAVKHHFIDCKHPSEDYNAGLFEKDCISALNQYFTTHSTALLVGGSGLYLKAVLEGFDDLPKDKSIRNQIKSSYNENGLDWLRNEVLRLDPDFSNPSDLSNPQRLMRALEVMTITDERYSALKLGMAKPRNFTTKTFALIADRDVLYKRINQRVLDMMQLGLLDEVKKLSSSRSYNSLQTVGYKEIFEHLDGKYDLATAVNLIQQHTRNYAKRQLTWFKNQGSYIQIKTPFASNLKKHL